MAHVLSVGEYFSQENPKLAALRETLLSLPIPEKPIEFKEPVNEGRSEESESLNIYHQIYLLENFDSIEEINTNENYLLLNNYNPTFLVESGVYEHAVKSIELINEGFLSSIKAAWNAMTEDGSPIGIFQFFLDIIGIIPASWFGFPIDIAANLLNAVIYFIRDKFLLGFINLVACVDLSKVFAPLKLGIKAIARPASTLIKALGKSGAGSGAAMALKASKEGSSNPGVVKMLGTALGKIGRWLLTSGIKMIRRIVPQIIKAINKLTFGAFKLEKYIPRITAVIDGWAGKLTTFAKEADAASKVLLSKETAQAAKGTIAKSAKKVGAVSKEAGEIEAAAAGKSLSRKAAKELSNDATNAVLKDLGLIKTAAKEAAPMSRYHIELLGRATRKFNKNFPNVTDQAIKNRYIYNEATKEMVGNVLSKKSGLVNILGNKKVIAKLASGQQWKGAEKLMGTAIRNGNPKQLGELMQKMLDDPDLYKLISKNSPDVAKTMAMFRHYPEALVRGARVFSEFGSKSLAKGFLGAGVTQRFAMFLLKQVTKGSACEDVTDNIKDPSELADLAKRAAQSASTQAAEVFEQTEAAKDPIGFSQKSLEELKAVNPQAYNELVKSEVETNNAIEKVKEETNVDPQNPCKEYAAVKMAEAGGLIYANNQIYQEGYMGSIDMTTSAEHDKANTLTKGYLQKMGLDAEIDAQHPLEGTSSETKAYFAPVVHSNGKIEPSKSTNETVERVTKVVDDLIANGDLEPERRDEIIKKMIEHYKNNTVPAPVINAGLPEPSANESIFNVGKLITKR